jgi:hypothetical protein
MADDALTYETLHAQVQDLRLHAVQQPERIELGKTQRAAIEAYFRDLNGQEDVGPILEFNGLPVVKSRRDDHVRLLASGDEGDDVEVEMAEAPVASGPEALSVEEPQSNG